MSDTVKKSLKQSAKSRMENAKCELLADLYEKKRLQINGKYDATTHTGKRKRVQIETQSEEEILPLNERFTGTSISRDLTRNFTNYKGFLRQFRNFVVGTVAGKVAFKTDNAEWNKKASSWFNGVYAKNCDSRSDLTLCDLLGIGIQTIKSEGDFVIVFDNFDLDDGKLLFYESDQVVSINENEWKQQTMWVQKVKDANGKTITIPLCQNSGVVTDNKGRELGVICTAKRGQTSVKYNEATIFPRSVAKFVRNRTRFNMLRGVADSLSLIGDMADIQEMRGSELLSAKTAARTAMKVTKKDAAEDMLMKSGISPELLESASDLTTPATTPKDNLESFESYCGGFIEYLTDGEDVEILDPGNRPNINVQNFFDFVLGSAGASMGLPDCFSKLKVSTSYTAFRGELLIAFAQFYVDQKFLERYCCDWICEKAISWAIEKKILPEAPEGWQSSMSWQWVKLPQINPDQEWTAINNAIKNGYLTFADVLGADWKEKLDNSAEQILYAQSLGIPISAFETKAGAITDTQNIEDNNNDTNTDNNDNNGDNQT